MKKMALVLVIILIAGTVFAQQEDLSEYEKTVFLPAYEDLMKNVIEMHNFAQSDELFKADNQYLYDLISRVDTSFRRYSLIDPSQMENLELRKAYNDLLIQLRPAIEAYKLAMNAVILNNTMTR